MLGCLLTRILREPREHGIKQKRKGRKRGSMNTKFAELVVKTSADYNGEVVKALEDAGFILTLDRETFFEIHYIVAKAESEKE